MSEDMDDFWNYFEANRLFGSAEQIYELWDIYHQAWWRAK